MSGFVTLPVVVVCFLLGFLIIDSARVTVI